MNRIADAMVADYAFARAAYARHNSVSDFETMTKIKEAAKVLWPNLALDFDAAADKFVADMRNGN